MICIVSYIPGWLMPVENGIKFSSSHIPCRIRLHILLSWGNGGSDGGSGCGHVCVCVHVRACVRDRVRGCVRVSVDHCLPSSYYFLRVLFRSPSPSQGWEKRLPLQPWQGGEALLLTSLLYFSLCPCLSKYCNSY